MKPSKYNMLKKINNKYYIFNTLTGSISELEEEVYNYFLENDLDKIAPELVNLMEEEGYLIEKAIDEDLILHMNHLKSQFNSNYLGLVVAPTMDCNFACPYCYENRIKGSMADLVQD